MKRLILGMIFSLLVTLIGANSAEASTHKKSHHARSISKKHHIHKKSHRHHKATAQYTRYRMAGLPNQPDVLPQTSLKRPFATDARLVSQVDTVLRNLRSTRYQYGGNRFDVDRGVFNLDCSHYVDHLVAKSNPIAFANMRRVTGSTFPATRDYYSFIRQLPYYQVTHNWVHIRNANHLQPGDVIVYQKYSAKRRGASAGHIMIVTSTPKRDPYYENIFHVAVSDSAHSGHGNDTRPRGRSGVGMGTMLVKVDPYTGEPYQFAWKQGARFETGSIAMARPVA